MTGAGHVPTVASAGAVRLAAALLGSAGLVDILAGVSELDIDPYLVVTDEGLVRLDVTGWLWLHVGTGSLALVAALVVLTGRRWAWWVGVVAAVAAGAVNLLFLPYHPLRAALVLGLYLAAARLVLRSRPVATDGPVSTPGAG
ncbi:DUF7144 family membrane protein [Micromonospora cathayae]|uniref:DUF7144 domain-containing protein n=1 Tax=Micromonospora cathayae TaxID=3028804 RepID=A0ABY8A079_9ACTN|nr:hypothetical protein [Micromonospora sp. HUAS 3]WDZ87668.1 hypothetical protein PVK37_15285 [Micromonospora sp. HUAS 3]